MSSDGEGVPCIVVPTIRGEQHFREFLEAWKDEFRGCHLIVVEDREKSELIDVLEDCSLRGGYTYMDYDWRDIERDLGKDAWIISRKTSAIRSYGYLRAYRNKALFIATLDDDVKPAKKGHIKDFYNKLFQAGDVADNRFFNTLKNRRARGTPTVHNPKVGIVHGGWFVNHDLCAKDQIGLNEAYRIGLEEQWVPQNAEFNEGVIPRGALVSICGMNLAFRTELSPHMYFGLQGHIRRNKKLEKLPIDRSDDIWAGIHAKRYCDANGYYVLTGAPFCIHTRASEPWNNLKKENGAEEMTQDFIDFDLHGIECMDKDLAYWQMLGDAYQIWSTLFE